MLKFFPAPVSAAQVVASTIGILLTMVVLPSVAPAQEQQAFRSLIGRGFEIRAVTFVKGEATGDRETFVVTLQREKSVAVCYFAATSWINLSPNALEDSKRCDVR